MKNPVLAETREQCLTRLEAMGELDPTCAGCLERYSAPTRDAIFGVFAPRHKASNRCESGKYAHCSCSVCF